MNAGALGGARVALAHAAAFAAGFGGLLVELTAVRRTGLLAGNTAAAAALVVGVFLLGLGAGGLLVARLKRRMPERAAALAYALVAVAIACGDTLLAAQAPGGGARALLLVLVHPGIAALLMGVAFPLLLDGARSAGRLVAVNLLGSVVACAIGGNLLVPELGLDASRWIAVAAYATAALAGACGPRVASGPEARAEPARLPAAVARAAALAGLAVVGLQVLLLRRLPFWFEGFQPTLSGVLAACLVALALGAALARPLGRACGGAPRALVLALGAAALLVACGLHEVAGRALTRLPVDGTLGMHARIWAGAFAGALPCVMLGAVVPLAIHAAAIDAAANEGVVRATVAGRVLFVNALGAAAGAFVAGHVLPLLAPDGFFVWLPLTLGLALSLLLPARLAVRAPLAAAVVLLSCIGVSGPGRPWAPDPPIAGSRFDRPERYRYLAHRTDAAVTASAVYDPSQHSMALFTDEFRAAYTGPGTAYMKVLGHLPFLLRDDLRDVAVIALGTGTTAQAVCAWPAPRAIHVVEISPAVLALADWFGGDGPLRHGAPPAFLADPRTAVHVADGRAWLVRQEPASLDLVTMEPLLPYAPGTAPLYSAEFYALASSRVRPRGLVVQWLPTHALRARDRDALLRTFAQAFAHTSVWLVDQSTLLVGSAEPHLDAVEVLAARLQSAPPAAATMLHEAGLARGDDLLAAHVTAALRERLGPGEVLGDDRPFLERVEYWSGEQRLAFYPDNLACLSGLVADGDWGGVRAVRARRARLRAAIALSRAQLPPELGGADPALAAAACVEARAALPDSTLLHREETLAWRLVRERAVLDLRGAPAADVARRQLPRDGGSALLLACAAVAPGADREHAVGLALALDPTLLDRPPAVLEDLVPPKVRASPLADLARLPEGRELAAAAARDDALGAALRGAFPVRCARAAVAVAAAGPLAEARALGPVFDPASLDAIAAAIAARGGEPWVEVGSLWRQDLPMPAAFAAARDGDAAARTRLAHLLGGHRDARALEALAALLEDVDAAVREAAGAALFLSLRDAVAYDPGWPESRLREAARAVRALHNPAR